MRRSQPGYRACSAATTGSSCLPRRRAPARRTFDARAPEHIAWLLTLERDGVLFLSGPLLSGPGTGPGSGVTILRAADEGEAGSIAAEDPFAVKGLRTFTVHRWRLNEGSIGIRLSLGAATYDWR